MFALGNKSRGNNRIIASPFHMKPVPEHIFLHLATAPSGDAVRMNLDTGHQANAADIGNKRMILKRPDGIKEIILKCR
jgi:hypothetical protein